MPSSILRSMIVSMLLGVVTSTTAPLQFTKTANSTEVGQARQKNLRERAMERDVEVDGGISCQSEYATFESLRSEASAVVYGRIIESTSFFDESGHPMEHGENITTEYSVEVLTVLRDLTFESAIRSGRGLPAALATPLKIARNGGVVYVNGHCASVKVEGYESLELGKQYVFFLFWSPDYNAYVLAGGLSGVMLVNGDWTIRPFAASEAIQSKVGRLNLESLSNEVIDAPTLDYDTEISREKSISRKAKDERFRGHGNPDSKKPIFELPQGIEPLPSNVHWWIGLPALPVDQSDVIVLGKVVERTSHLTDDRTGIYSEFALQVEDVFKDKSGSVKSSEPLVANRAGGNVRFASGKVQSYIISKQGMPLKGSRYVLFLRSTAEGDLMILTGFELRKELVIPLDGDTRDVRSALPFAKYRDLGEFLFLADLHEALANSNSAGKSRT